MTTDPTPVRTADGTRLNVETAGAGPAVLLVQGLGYATWAWAPQVGGLQRHRRVLAFDNRGAGRSDKPPGPYSIRLLADDALAVLDAHGIDRADVIGCSMGGYIALTLALAHPDRVRSLVLVATSAGGPTVTPVPAETTSAWAAAAHLPPADFARTTMPLSFAPGWVEAHPARFEELLAARLAYPTPQANWRAQYEACEQYLNDGVDVEAVTCPALVVHGTADRVVPYPNGAELADRLPDARLVPMEGAGHLCWLERPAEFEEAVVPFLTSAVADA